MQKHTVFDITKASIDKLNWNDVSRSFDSTSIRMTKPGFGVICLILPGQSIHRFRDKLSSVLLLRTRDVSMHMTIFQVFITFNEEYDPYTLPPNLLQVFQEYFQEQLHDQLKEIQQFICSQTIQLTDQWLILGVDMPTHLTIQVQCKQVDDLLLNLKHRANEVGQLWMGILAEELKVRGIGGEIIQNPTGLTIRNKGWSLTIGYTANADHKMHITLGILNTYDLEMNEIFKLLHGDVNRIINPIFSPEEGDAKHEEMRLRYLRAITRIRNNQLRNFDERKIISYPHLADQVMRAKQEQDVKINKFVIDEWGKYNVDNLDYLKSIFDDDNDLILHLAGIRWNVINMSRTQNFEA